ncbi:unnamed protein product [Euphydryas editha]|uniref:Uncharacterized protein n=1 Tax=Euphydryas editha TaxID=104508 RepID=A0AAU9UJU8_EUPED|nr:unnamed protein product [Euphydryas editha]
MTSENDVLKTNEFLRRRKLRLQQVREQSKDIAKKIRQRAKIEKLRHVTDIDSKKEKEYLDCQEKLVKRLESFYSKSLQNVGASHKKAGEVSSSDVVEKVDLSKLRGKEAVAELRKHKQEILDKQKKLLDRKLQAREAANEISREKCSMTAKNLTKQAKKVDQLLNKTASNTEDINDKDGNKGAQKSNPDVTKTDMATQWESGELPNEWDPNVPELSLPKENTAEEIIENKEKSDKNKKPNLFALSDEMPSSLRGGLSSVPEQLVHIKPSLTLVSEYLQNRNLRLRQFEPIKKPADDLQSIKQTILRTRSSRTDGSVFDSICHVLDEQVIPVPSWQAEEKHCPCNSQIKTNPYFTYNFSKFPINNLHGASWSNQRHFHLNQFSKLPPRSNNLSHGTKPGHKEKEKSFRSTDPEVSRIKSISIYNHNTRDIKDVPYGEEHFVSHDKKSDEDAYAQALQETASVSNMEKEKLHKRQQEMRNKVAVTKQNVDKEYRDTLAFLNLLSKDKDISHKPYIDDQRQQIQKDRHQRQMQQEFKKIEKECHKQNCKHNKRKLTVLDKSRSKSKSPVNINECQRRHFEYSWMPVPESDDNFAIHTLPTTTKTKSGNTVKFTEPNSYHEYRSRHKHTPPTRDVNDNRHSKKIVETVIVQQNSNDDESEPVSETSSVENMSLESDQNMPHVDSKLKDADRIIIYKILDSRNKRIKNHKKLKSTTNNEKSVISGDHHSEKAKSVNIYNKDDNTQKVTSFEHLQEGIYKGLSSNGDNITSINIQDEEEEVQNQNRRKDKPLHSCCCEKAPSNTSDKDVQKDGGDNTSRSRKPNLRCYCGKKTQDSNLLLQSSETTSATSFKTAPNDRANVTPDAGFIKLIDEGGHESGKFYIGASGFIKDDNYEVVIQLRKKEGEKNNSQENRDAPIPNISTEKLGVSSLENKQNTVVVGESNCLSKSIEENLVNPSNLETNKVKDSSSEVILNNNQELLTNKKSEDNVSEPIVQPQTKNVCEKAIHTSFNDSYAIPVHLPKTDNIPRPATSTYTQTSFNSSIHRPAFMHMSSSTSTAYMSPPELVLPNFLKHDYIMTQEELFESENTVNQTDPQYEAIGDDSKEYEKCSCKRCIYVKKVSALSLNPKRTAINTPPNTARSRHHCRLKNKSKQNETKKCKCHKCRCGSETKLCHKTHRSRTKSCDSNTIRDHSYENKNMKVQSSKHKRSSNKDNEDGTINPIVKNYVNRLLALNKEGLKAVEIINQECSIASTPGSSIINIPTNKQQSMEVVVNKISLEQIKNILKQQILEKNSNQDQKNMKPTHVKNTESQTEKIPKLLLKYPKKRSVHKVKSLNISRQLLHKKKSETRRPTNKSKICTSTSSSTREENKLFCLNTKTMGLESASKDLSIGNSEYKNSTSSDIAKPTNKKIFNKNVKNLTRHVNNDHMTAANSQKTKSNIFTQNYQNRKFNLQTHRAKATVTSSDSEVPSVVLRHITAPLSPTNISTQTNGTIDDEPNFMKVAEDKLQNMEKIADLTEKCTKRLSNLAKVLEEVRRNKSLVYSQISTSDSASESENKSDKNETENVPVIPCSKVFNEDTNKQLFSSLTIPANLDEKKLSVKDSTQFIPFLIDIPKPETFKTPSSDDIVSSNDKTTPTKNTITDSGGIKVRGRPPPALSRINLKNGSEISVTPHELSTVIEVDSPMSVKLKNQSSRQDIKFDAPEKIQIYKETENETNIYVSPEPKETRIDPDLLQSNVTAPKPQSRVLSTDSSDESKVQMIDLKQFNNIMLKPYITLQEYAKQCNVGLEEGSNVEDVIKDDPVNEDLSSLHSDGSLPDVIAELLKRNIISEPFKFDTASNNNSNTMSSESTMSVLALSKSKKKKSGVSLKNKENIADTSETLSISSNPDLENAFQKLGMGWASSTLKKTKERLALSSSSNTSSSSMTQFKIKTFSQVIPTFATDSTSSLLDNSNDERKKLNSPSRSTKNNHKNAVQQTSLTNSMTVKEFLTNELAKKITFSNKSTRKEDEEFVSLYETNMPDDMKNTNIGIQEDCDQSTVASNNVRARTSTPVQIFKSTTYKSTSSSNTSNGLFSNADDLSSVKGTSNSMRNHSTSDKDDLTIPNYSLKTRKELSDFSKSD